jgi:hypothetical protein
MCPESPAPSKPEADKKSHIKWGAIVFLDRLGTKAVWTKNPSGDAIRRSEERLEKARNRFGSQSTVEAFYLADLSSATANSTFVSYVDFDTSPGAKTPSEVFQVTVPVNFDLPDNVIGFSDTLIVWREIQDRSNVTFDGLSTDVIHFFNDTLADGDFYRGVISVGEFVATRNAVLGPAVHEAGAWYEATDWMGVSLTPSAEWFVGQREGFSNPDMPYAESRIPRRPRRDSDGQTTNTLGVALAWPRYWEGGRKSLLQVFSGQLVTPDLETKYRNTLAFFDSVSISNKSSPPP